MKLRNFVDFWNFQLNWNNRAAGKKPDWPKLPLILKDEADKVLKAGGLGSLVIEETCVYASYEPGREASLKNWLNTFLDRQPGFRVFTVERHWKKSPVHCRKCSRDISVCPNCGSDLGRAAEKTVDSRIVTDMLSLAWEGGIRRGIVVKQ